MAGISPKLRLIHPRRLPFGLKLARLVEDFPCMKRSLVPMVAALALCGGATMALIANSAGAEPEAKRPMMVAMALPHPLIAGMNAAAPDDGANPPGMGQPGLRRPTVAEIAARHKQMCQDEYAHQVGQLAYLEAKLNLTPSQQPLFDRWKSVKLDIAKRGQADCSTRDLSPRNVNMLPSPLEGMAREEYLLRRRLADLDAERPALSALYATMNANQKDALMHPDGMMGGPMMGHMFAMDARRDRMEPAPPNAGNRARPPQ
jgi:hypothetical protein